MDANTSVATVFLGFLLVFLCATTFLGNSFSLQQWRVVRFLASVSAALAATFFSGKLALELNFNLVGKLATQATSGFGLFILVFYLWDHSVSKQPETSTPDAVSLDIPEAWTVEEALSGLANSYQLTLRLELPSALSASYVSQGVVNARSVESAAKAIVHRASQHAEVDVESDKTYLIVRAKVVSA